MIEDKKSHARGLYFQTRLTQQEIADRVGVNRKTLYLWINEEKWQDARLAAAQSPTILLHQYYQQLINLNEFIAARTESPFPTTKEAEVIRKLSTVIKQLSTKINLGAMVEVFNLFTDDFLNQGHSTQEAIDIRKYMDDFLKRRFHIHKRSEPSGAKYAQDDQIVTEYKQWEATYPSASIPTPEDTGAPQNEENLTSADGNEIEDNVQKINAVAQTSIAPSMPRSQSLGHPTTPTGAVVRASPRCLAQSNRLVTRRNHLCIANLHQANPLFPLYQGSIFSGRQRRWA